MIWQLFFTFFQIGLFTFGGGYAMIPMIQDMVLSKNWCDLQTLVDFIAVSESTPGTFAINIATFIGSEKLGVAGALAATFGVVAPSFVIILLIAKNVKKFENNAYVKAAMFGLRPIVVGMIAAACLSVMRIALIASDGESALRVDWKAGVIFCIVLALSQLHKKIHPIFLVVLSAGLGILCYGVFASFGIY